MQRSRLPRSAFPHALKESISVSETTMNHPAAPYARRVRHISRTTEPADRRQAAAALQRALDRRDNGGVTGH